MNKLFEIITEIVGWLQIFLSPVLIGSALGFAIYYYIPNDLGFLVAILIFVLGIIIGVFWATKLFKTSGTIHFISRIAATEVLENKPDSKIRSEDKKV